MGSRAQEPCQTEAGSLSNATGFSHGRTCPLKQLIPSGEVAGGERIVEVLLAVEPPHYGGVAHGLVCRGPLLRRALG